MPNTIQIKYSEVTATPPSLERGEPAYSEDSGTLFIGATGNAVTKIGGAADVAKLALIEAEANKYVLPSSVVHKTSNQALSDPASQAALTISDHTITLRRGDDSTESVTVPDNNTTYSIGDGGLTANDFTTTLKDKLDGIEAAATADQTTAEIIAGIELADLYIEADTLGGVTYEGFMPRTADAVLGVINVWQKVASVTGANLGSMVQFSAVGTADNVVIAASGKLTINHLNDIQIELSNGGYSALNVQVQVNNTADFDVYIKTDSATPVGLALEIHPLNGEAVLIDNILRNTDASFEVLGRKGGTVHRTTGGLNSSLDTTEYFEAGVSLATKYAPITHTHAISSTTGLQAALDGKVDDGQVLTNVPSGAVFTDTTYTVASLGVASQAEAESGANVSKIMTPLRVAQAISAMADTIQNKYDATIPPTSTDDSSDGYAIGSFWIDITGNDAYRCVDATVDTAVWIKTSLEASDLGSLALLDSIDGGEF